MIYLIILASSISAVAGQIFLKLGSSHKQHFIEFINWQNFIGCVFYLIGLLLWIYSLSKLPLSIVYAFTMITFVLVYVSSKLWLHEPISWLTLLGIGFILVGFFCIVIGQNSSLHS